MGKPEARIHLSNKFSWAKATNSNKSVIISVYVESPRKCSHHKTGDHLTNKAKRNPLFRRPQGAETKCYDRRAELLAYVRQLRDGGARHSRRDSLRLKFEEKKSKLSSAPVRIETSMRRIFRRNERQDRYEKIVSEENCGVVPEFHSRNKKTPSPRGNIASSFCNKLKRMFKGLSCGLTCSER